MARSYGRGLTETLVGRFLARRPDATVATKYGLLPPRAGRFGLARQALGPWSDASAAPRGPPRPPRRSGKPSSRPANAAKASLEVSLKALRRDRVELFLLHEATADDLVHDDLLAFLEERKAAGVIGDFGIGGPSAHVPELWARRRPYCHVLQSDWTPLEPVPDRPGAFPVLYRVFGEGRAA